MSAEGDVNRSGRRTQWQAEHLSAETRAVLDADADVFLHQALSTPCLNAIVRAEGSWIEDAQGRRYLDFHGNSAHQVGYGHPRVVRAVKEQLDQLPFCPRRYANEPATEFARRLVELAPAPLSRVLFTPSGAGAVGIALKVARIATGRFKTVSMWGSFHGASLEAISIGGEEHFRDGLEPLLPGAFHVPPYDPWRHDGSWEECASAVEAVLDREGDVGAVIAEPIRATTAVRPPAEYWQRIRVACDRHGALLIFDEIPTGLGRTGAMFAFEHMGVVPDILVLGKGLGGGLFPMAAALISGELSIPDSTSLGHYTHEKSPVGAVAGVATLDVIRDEGLVRRSHEKGAWLHDRLVELQIWRPQIREVRSTGLLLGVEMSDARAAEETMYRALDHGLSFKVSAGTVLTLAPPLTISDEELGLAVLALDRAMEGLDG